MKGLNGQALDSELAMVDQLLVARPLLQDLTFCFQIKYTVDPAFMQAGEKQTFLKYLSEQKLYIDMWDGDSMLLIGSTSTPLKYLLRQAQPSVQVSQELNVVFTEYAEDHPMLAGDLTDTGLPTGIKVSLKAKLCLRMANVGYIPDTNLEKIQVSLIICYSKYLRSSLNCELTLALFYFPIIMSNIYT